MSFFLFLTCTVSYTSFRVYYKHLSGGGGGGALPPIGGRGHLVQEMGGATSDQWGEQSVSVHVNITTSTIVFTLQCPYPLPLVKRSGILPVKPKDQHSVQPPLSAVGGGLSLQPNFQKMEAWQDFSFQRRVAGRCYQRIQLL